MKLKRIKSHRQKTSKDTINARRKHRYDNDVEYKERQKAAARRAYRRKAGVELSVSEYALDFVEELGKNRLIEFPNGSKHNMMVFGIKDTALVMQKSHQAIWRWVERGQLPEPILLISGTKGNFVYCVDEIRIFITEVAKHERKLAYYRRDHKETRESIFSLIDELRHSLKME